MTRGGKMIIYQGWADPIVPPLQTVAFYKGAFRQVRRRSGAADGFARLFLAPGFGHCFGGPAASTGSTPPDFGGFGPAVHRRRP